MDIKDRPMMVVLDPAQSTALDAPCDGPRYTYMNETRNETGLARLGAGPGTPVGGS